MKVYEPQNIRNISLTGHANSGKTTLAESILLESGFINRKGTVEEHNTVSDFNEIEHERNCTILNTLMFAEWGNYKINFIDTPGYDDYIGEMCSAVRVSDTTLIVLNSHNGVETGTENAWDQAKKYNRPVAFVINKIDVDQANFDETVEEIKHIFGGSVKLVQFPLHTGASFNSLVDIVSMSLCENSTDGGKDTTKDIPESEKSKADALRNDLIESIAETNEELMNKYLENGELTNEEIAAGFKKAIISRQIFPIFCISGKNNVGIPRLLYFITEVLPSPVDMPPQASVENKEVKCDSKASTVLFIFKLMSEAHLGDMTFFRVYSGKITPGTDLTNEQKGSAERFNQLFVVNGKKRVEVPTILAGDIGATVKLKNTHINDTLHEKGKDITIKPIEYPKPRVRTAVVPKTKGEEEKVGMGLNGLHVEDPTLVIEHSQELRQMILHAQGELHLSAARWRLEHRYKVEAEFVEPRVPYRETIQKQVRGSYRHKKQTGGAGQFAEVHMMVEPWTEGMPNPEGLSVRGKDLHDLDWGGKLEFLNCIVGGVIDQRFLPAILKGVMEKMHVGPLTGCYVRDIRVTIYDGKMHPVDSNEAAFKTAGLMVFKDNFIQANPKILEPIFNIEIKVPEDSVGDVMSDLPTRRGVILGVESLGRYQIINARMPLAELDKYSAALRSMTAGRATYTQEFAEYQAVPPIVQQELIESYKKQQQED
jgi:elongation factor G